MQWHCTFQILESWPWPQGNPIITRYAWKTRKALWTLIDVRLKAAKVRFSQFLEYSDHCITSAKERREGKRYLYTSTRLLVVFSLSWTLYFTTVDSDNYTLYSYASIFVWKRRFFLLFGLDRLHVSCEYGQRKRIFSKPLSRTEIFGNAVLLCSITSRCSGNQPTLTKTEFFENDYVTVSDTYECAFSYQRWYRFQASWDRVFVRMGKNAYEKTATYRRRSFSKRNKKFCIQTNRIRMDGYRIRCRLLSVDRILARRILMRCIVAEVHFSALFISYASTFKYWSLHWSIDLHGFEYFIKWMFTRK